MIYLPQIYRSCKTAVRLGPLVVAMVSFLVLRLNTCSPEHLSRGAVGTVDFSSPEDRDDSSEPPAAMSSTAVAVLGIVLAAPLSHVSMASKLFGMPGYMLFMPFRGGSEFVLMQALG
eukprot:SAG31_NODE_1608_length_7760_cov_3.045425_4_plen_117_part_00